MEIINKVAESGIITLDLEQFYPKEEIVEFDIKQYLFKELILKEIEFRQALKTIDWSQYQNKIVTIFCSSDAILPQWSFMLITQYLVPYTSKIYFGNKEKVEQDLYLDNIKQLDTTIYIDQRVVIKGCSNKKNLDAAFVEISKLLIPKVKSLFFGEPCSTVPIYKKK